MSAVVVHPDLQARQAFPAAFSKHSFNFLAMKSLTQQALLTAPVCEKQTKAEQTLS